MSGRTNRFPVCGAPPHRSLQRGVLALLLAASLGACTTLGPDYARPTVPLPQAWPDAPETQGAAQRIDAGWWRLYGDPQLTGLVESAIARNPDALIAAAQVEEAEAVLREAHAALFPQVDVAGQGTRSRVSTAGAQPVPPGVPVVRSDFRATLSTAFEIDFWGRLRRAEEAVRAQLAATRSARDVTALTLAGTTAQAYFLLRSLDAQIGLSRATLALREESTALVRSRVVGGIASELELRQAEGAAADIAAQIVELRRQRAQLRHQLAALTARPGMELEAGDLERIPVPPAPPPGLPSALLDRRPDVRAAEQALVAANARIGVAKAAMMPTISLTGSFGTQSRDLSDLLTRGAGIWSVGAGLTLPLFDAGRLAARADQAEARARQAVAGYAKVAENAYREVADALTNVQRSAESEAAQQSRVDAAAGAARLARKRWEAGYSPYLEVLDAERGLNDASLAVLRARQARLAYSVDLMKSLGGGWSGN
ncbi:MAG: hypothetical protein RIS35_1778 [Pseudomonadota bacterium]